MAYMIHLNENPSIPHTFDVQVVGNRTIRGRVVNDDGCGYRAIVTHSDVDHQYLGDFPTRHKAAQAVCVAYSERLWTDLGAITPPTTRTKEDTMNQPLNVVCQFCNDTGVTPQRTICKRCYTFARLDQKTRDERLHPAPVKEETYDISKPLLERGNNAQKRARNAPARIVAVTAVAALALALLATPASAQDLTACYPNGTTGEGFPVITCADGNTFYQDMDGDGRDESTNGRYILCNEYC
jgi:hypothetical protein